VRILCVEDEDDIRVVMRLTLEAVGRFTVQCCASGAEAVGVASEFAPDLILLDVMMPSLDGPATLLALRALPGLASTPVVFVTAQVAGDDTANLMALGAIGVITKPFNPMALPGKLREIWARHA
jgi:two-component system, OmpR family, response regulator